MIYNAHIGRFGKLERGGNSPVKKRARSFISYILAAVLVASTPASVFSSNNTARRDTDAVGSVSNTSNNPRHSGVDLNGDPLLYLKGDAASGIDISGSIVPPDEAASGGDTHSVPERIAKTDRYIIKYDEPSDAKEVRRKLRKSVKPKAIEGIDGTKIEPTFWDWIRGIQSPQEEMEVIVLKEPAAPSELARKVSEMDISENVEYIQPDYILRQASFSLEAADYTDTNADNRDAMPKAIAGGEGTQGAVDKPEAKSENNGADTVPINEMPTAPAEATPVVVAVLDSGTDINHPNIAPYLWRNADELPGTADNDGNGLVGDINGWNFAESNNEIFSSERPNSANHGTHIAGIIAKTWGDNGVQAQIMPLKVFSGHSAYTSDIIAAIEYATDNGARVINMSFGGTSENPALREAIANSDALFVCAAGNNRVDLAETPVYPACYDFPNVINVASVNADDGFSYFSNYGAGTVDIAAPGKDIESAYPENKTGKMNGTSMSAAFVSAGAAAVLANETLSVQGLKERLIVSADRLSNLELKTVGARRLNIANAVAGVTVTDITECDPADDYDVHGYLRTPAENMKLFSDLEIVKIESGYNHTLALMSDGTVWAWGDNSYGQLGDTSVSGKTLTPVQVQGLPGDATDISAYGYYSLAVIDGGDGYQGYVWGNTDYGNYAGEYNNRPHIDSVVPMPLREYGLTESVMSIIAGQDNIYAICRDGAKGAGNLYMFGWKEIFLINHGNTMAVSTDGFELVQDDVRELSTNGSATICLSGNGVLWRYFGEISFGYYQIEHSRKPSGVFYYLDMPATDVAARAGYGDRYSVLNQDGTIWEWDFAESPDAESPYGYPFPYPTTLLGTGSFSDSQGEYVIRDDGAVISPLNESALDKIAASLTDIKYINTRGFSNFAIDKQGNVWAWGENGSGQLGDGTTTDREFPVLINERRWAAQSCTIAFERNGAMDGAASSSVNYLSKKLADWSAPSRDGYVFKGYYTSGTGGSKIIDADGVLQPNVSGYTNENGQWINRKSDTTLYARWSPYIGTTIYSINATKGEKYTIAIKAQNAVIELMDGEKALTYDPTKLKLIDFAMHAQGYNVDIGAIDGTGLDIISHNNTAGELTYTISKIIPAGKAWTGNVTLMEFEALESGYAEVEHHA
jgi:uncharacterized repeat protein (TIGR02543 family)